MLDRVVALSGAFIVIMYAHVGEHTMHALQVNTNVTDARLKLCGLWSLLLTERRRDRGGPFTLDRDRRRVWLLGARRELTPSD